MGREDPQLKLRLTEAMKAAVTEAARENNRSVNAEIVQRLEQSFDSVPELPNELLERIDRKADELKIPARILIRDALEEAFPFGYTAGDFIDKWAIPITKEVSPEKRKGMIIEANHDPESRAGGWSLIEVVHEGNAFSFIEIYQRFENGRDIIASMIVPYSGKE